MNEHSRVSAYSPARVALLLGLFHLAGGCSDSAEDLSPDDVPTFRGTVDLEFGEVDGDDPYLFTRIESIVEDASGRLIVADLQSHEVRVFGSEGDFRLRFGGQGEGPGELTQPCCLAFGPDGALWVRESTRYSVFRLDGGSANYDRGARIAHTGQGMVAPVTFDAGGRLVDIGSVTTEDGFAMARLHHGRGGAVDTVMMADPERQMTGSTTVERMFGDTPIALFVYQLFGPRWLHAHGPGGVWAEAVTSEYAVTLHQVDGTVSRIEGPALSGPSLSPSERESAQAAIDRDLQRLDLQNHPFNIPDRKPPLAAIFFDRSGRLWVERTGAHGDELRVADVYAESELVARYRWPRRVRAGAVPWVTESTLYGVTSDSLDVQRVARVRFEPGS